MATEDTVIKVEETKGIARSKINISGLLLVLCSAISDPFFRAYFGDLIPEVWASRLTFIVGWAIIYFRSNNQNNIMLDWHNPWKSASPALVEETTTTSTQPKADGS